MGIRVAGDTRPSITVANISSAEKAAMLRAAIAWVAALGRDLSHTRFGHYLAELEDYAQRLADGRTPDNSPLFYAASADGYVLSHAYQQLRGRYDQYVANRIGRACRGTDTVGDEDGANSEGRNFCFELSLASWLVSCGLALNCNDPADIAGEIAGHYLILECKRVRSDKKVEMRGKEAIAVLSERLANPDHENMVGAVAFDFTPIVNPAGEVLRRPHLDARALFEVGVQLARKFAASHARHWRAWGHPGVVAVFNRVQVSGADTAAPKEATLQQFTMQAMHRLADANSPHWPFLQEIARVSAEQGTALLSANQEARTRL